VESGFNTDSVPRPIRLLVGLLISLALLAKAGVFRAPFRVSYHHIWQTLQIGAVLALVVIGVAVAFWRITRSRPSTAASLTGTAKSSEGYGGTRPRPVLVYRLNALSDDSAEVLRKLLLDRVKRTGLEYGVITLFTDDGSASFLVIRGTRESEILIEDEVLKSLATLLEKFRLERVEADFGQCISSIYDTAVPRKRESGIVIIGESSRSAVSTIARSPADIVLGTTLNTPVPQRVGLKYSDIYGHVAIFGATGSGKSTTAAVLACRIMLSGAASVVVLDWTGEYVYRLRPCGALVVDPLRDGIGLWPREGLSIDVALEVLSLALELTPPQEYLLFKVLSGGRYEGLAELLEAVEKVEEESKWDREVKRALIRKLGLLASQYPIVFSGSGRIEALSLKGLIIIDLSRINLTLARRLAALLFLAREYQRRRELTGKEPPVVYILDEAHNVISAPESTFAETLLAEARKYGMHIVIVTQSPAAVPNGVILNTSTKIIHALRSHKDKETIASSIGLNSESALALDKLGVGEALVYAPSLGEPLLIRVELPHPLRKNLQDSRIS
jgi:hypothetical protein